jgi:hypothetical protein
MSLIGFKAKFINLEPTTPASVPNETFFVDSTNDDKATFKDTLGNLIVIGGAATNLFIKQMQASVAIGINQPVSKLPNGKIVPADSDSSDGQEYIGITLGSALADELVDVLLPGANIVGALTGSGFVPGDEVFIGENGGYTNNVGTFLDNNDSIIKVGIADCSAGVASNVVNDLVALTEIIARP